MALTERFSMAACALVLAVPALALEGSCPGDFSATPIHSLPKPVVAALDMSNPSPENQALAQAFSAGLRDAGLAIGAAPTVRIRVTYQLYGDLNATGRGANDDWGGQNSWQAMQGGLQLAVPDIPHTRLFQRQAPAQPVQLMARIELRDAAANTVAWVAVVRCSMRGEDNDVAFDLGRLVGQYAGQRISQQPL